jgi:hypothetical protein
MDEPIAFVGDDRGHPQGHVAGHEEGFGPSSTGDADEIMHAGVAPGSTRRSEGLSI